MHVREPQVYEVGVGEAQVCVEPLVYARGPLVCVWTLRCMPGPSAVYGEPLRCVQGLSGVCV